LLTQGQTGEREIENAFKDLLAENRGLKLRIDVNSVRFLTPDMAIADGTMSVNARAP
jgi:hypothetical protein